MYKHFEREDKSNLRRVSTHSAKKGAQNLKPFCDDKS